jgi:hypothetical protein
MPAMDAAKWAIQSAAAMLLLVTVASCSRGDDGGSFDDVFDDPCRDARTSRTRPV